MTAILNTDDQRGHFILSGLEVGHSDLTGEVIGADLGTALSLHTSGAYLTPSQARMLADALVKWADRRDARTEAAEAAARDAENQPALFGGEA